MRLIDFGSVALIVAALGGSASAWAHGGGLNAQGCHNDRRAGDYHCHRGAVGNNDRGTSTSRAASLSSPSDQANSRFGVCGSKPTCGQMTSCAEARYHYQCGVARLDGDRDGVPCERLCGN